LIPPLRSLLPPPPAGRTGPAVRFELAGFVAEVHSDDPPFREAVSRLFYRPAPAGAAAAVSYNVGIDRHLGPERRHSITLGPDFQRMLTVTAFYPALLPALEVDVGARLVAAQERLLPLAAGAVDCGGRGVLIAGGYDDGCAPLVKALVDRGAGYLSDAVALLDPEDGTAQPVPKSIGLRRSLHPLTSHERRDLSFRDPARATVRYLPPRAVADGPRRIDVLLFPRQDPAAPPAVRPLSRAAALVRLMANSYHRPQGGAAAFAGLAEVARGAQAFEVSLNGLSRTCDLLLGGVLEGRR
jgi:hypothetical protein